MLHLAARLTTLQGMHDAVSIGTGGSLDPFILSSLERLRLQEGGPTHVPRHTTTTHSVSRVTATDATGRAAGVASSPAAVRVAADGSGTTVSRLLTAQQVGVRHTLYLTLVVYKLRRLR